MNILKTAAAFGVSIFLLTPCLLAQETTTPASAASASAAAAPQWKVGNIGLFIGGNNDIYQSMHLSQMKAFAKTQADLPELNLEDYDGEYYNRVDGAVLRFDVGLHRMNRTTGSYDNSRELQLGVNLHVAREGMIEYSKENVASNGYQENESIVYCIIENELELHGAYLFRKNFTWRLNAYTGIGASASTTFDNELLLIFNNSVTPDPTVYSTEEETYTTETSSFDAKQAVYSRAYIPFGVGYRFTKRLEANLDWRLGVGVQHVVNGPTNFIKKTGSTVVGIKYHFHI